MIQDILPSRLVNHYVPSTPADDDNLLVYDADGRVFACIEDGQIRFTKARDFGGFSGSVFLFAVDEEKYFLYPEGRDPEANGFAFYGLREIYDKCGGRSGKEVYAAYTAFHLWKWYADNKYCGKCGGVLAHHQSERALVCPKCGNTIYPRINPAVIVGVIKDDCILVTRYREGYSHNALVAGFTEIGETIEETVRREVMEEVGISVKNIRYYKSQPWGMAQDILMGFFCEADGDTAIHMDRNELRYAEWVKSGDIVLQPNSLSLTNEMMKLFNEKGAEAAKV